MFSSLGGKRLNTTCQKRTWILKSVILQFDQSADSQPIVGRGLADNRGSVGLLKNFVVDKINQRRFVFIVTARVSRLKPHRSVDTHENI